MKIAEGWKGGNFHPYLRSRAHPRLNNFSVYAGQSVVVVDLASSESRRGVETSTLPPLTCPRCGWPVGSIGCEVNCCRSSVIGFFSDHPPATLATGRVYIGGEFAREAK
jgi:hypothetical protein